MEGFTFIKQKGEYSRLKKFLCFRRTYCDANVRVNCARVVINKTACIGKKLALSEFISVRGYEVNAHRN